MERRSASGVLMRPYSGTPSFLAGGGEMGAHIRAFDWGRTPLGPPDAWPAPLRTVVRILLTTNHPVFVFWGPQRICLYNDAYSRSLGPEKHPAMLGAHGEEAWAEIWPIIGPQVEQVMAGGGATWNENQLVPITRHGRLEQAYWTYSYGPIDDEEALHGVGGVLVLCTETTSQILSEQQLRTAELRWRTLFDQAPGFVCVLRGPSHQFEYANEHYRQLIGHRDVVGRTVLEALPEVAEQHFIELLDLVYRTGETYLASTVPIRLDRSGTGVAELRFIDFVYQPVREPDGRISGIFVQGADVTDRKRIEHALAASERRLRIGLDSAKAGVFDWCIGTGEVHWTDGLFALLGLVPGSARPTHELWQRHVHSDDLPRVEAAVRKALATGERYSEEYRIVRPSGEVRWVLGQALIVADPGEPQRMIGALIDVHERRQVEAALRKSERRFRAMADDVPVLIWMTNARGSIEFANRQASEFFGVPLARLQADGWQSVLHKDDREHYVDALAAAARNKARFNARARVRHASGEWRWVESTAIPRISEDGRYFGHVGLSPDITELLATQDALHEADRRKDEFLATLSHELRNPLAPIRNAAGILRATGSEPRSREWASNVIDRQVNTMATLLDDLLDITRITRGTLTLSRQGVALNAVVEAALEVARPVIEARRHRFVADLPPALVDLEADPLRLSQALSNLLTNAAKYTDPGGTIRLRARVEDGGLVLSVTDTGIGLAPESLLQIFGMFSQVKAALDRSEGGLGIGLALVKGIVELHGGRIEARSDGVGHGSEFRIILPALATPRLRPERDTGAAPQRDRPARRVLVADDNRDGARSLALLLELNGHAVSVAHGGREALALARELQPEVIVLDIGMPELNGYEVAEALRAEPWGQGIKLIALTGWGYEEDKRRATAAGFDHHLTKPIDPDLIEALL